MDKMRLENRTAVVTGAAGGIGRAIAASLSRRGCHLALADVNEAGLAETADMIAADRVRVSRHRLDVFDRAADAAFPAIVRAAHPGVDLLVNNAGVAIAGTFDEVSEDDFEWLFGINFWGVVRMTRAFLPLLRSSDDARIVNLSSIYGIIALPGQTAYSASKFAVRGFSPALRHELQGSRIGVAAASAPNAGAQVTGIRHGDGSWTYVDANGRDIHAPYYARGMAEYNAKHGYQNEWNDHYGEWSDHGYAPPRHRRGHKAVSPQ
jgi:NAD(P)-dependent dehydrogenase (short-subunit alcohol dehydrogenase family)